VERYESYKESYPGGVCISGFRAWDEAKFIKELGGTLVYTDAAPSVRYKRMVSRARDDEKLISFEEFIERESEENGGINSQFSILGIKERADIVLDTEMDLQDFLNEATKALGL
ncbi:hypothetical protein KDA08_02905, partial [Candidatus Saccharibacteria bacterium]|nr:hypothetical protein [Candidatus Saccharibacteria bacterium]